MRVWSSTRARLRYHLPLLALLLPLVAQAAPRDDARRLFIQGLQAAEEHRYEDALASFQAAQVLYAHPATQYNIARALEDLQRDEEALQAYRAYQAMTAGDPSANDVSAPIAALQLRITPIAVPAAPSPAPAPSGAATSDELDRLAAIAAELQALSESIARRGEVPATPAEPSPEGPEEAEAAEPATEAPPPSDGGFLADAYRRIVVSASRYSQDPLDSPSTITVLTGDDLRLSGATNIGDLLRRVVGVDVMSLASPSPEVGIRGFNTELSNKVLVLIDGRSIQWDFIGSSFWVNLPITPDEIERIEVIRGPGSALYGANAMSGVINIITITPGEVERRVARMSVGHPGYLEATMMATGEAAGFGYRFSGGYQEQGRWAKAADLDEDSPIVPFQEDQDRASRTVRLNGRIDRTFLDQGYASLSGGYVQGGWEFFNIGALGDYGIDARNHYLRGDLAWGPVHLRSFWNHDQGTAGPWLEPAGTTRSLKVPVANDTADTELEATFAFDTGTVHHRINAGVGYRYKRIRFGLLEGGYDNPWNEHHLKAFVQEEFSWRWLTVVGSLRLDRHPLLSLAQTLSPRGALIFRVAPETSVRLTGGTAFRAPTAVESYTAFDLATDVDALFVRDYGGQTAPGTPGLAPERIATAEIGLHDQSTLFHEIDVCAYYNRVTDLIGLSAVDRGTYAYDPDADGWQVGTSGWVNRSDITYQAVGGEVDARVYPVVGLDLFANAAIQRIFEESPEGTVVDGSSSLLKLNGGGVWRSPWNVDLSAAAHYRSPQTWRLREFDEDGDLTLVSEDVSARLLFSGRLAVRPIPRQDLELAFTVWNPAGFVERHREHPKGQPVGARAFGTLSYSF